MPIIIIRSNVSLNEEYQNKLLLKLSSKASEIWKKAPESVLASYCKCVITLQGNARPAAFLEIQNCGELVKKQCLSICNEFYAIFSQFVSLDQNRIFFYFTNVKPLSAWKFIQGKASCLE